MFRNENPIAVTVFSIGEDVPPERLLDTLQTVALMEFITVAETKVTFVEPVPESPLVINPFGVPLLVVSVVSFPSADGVAISTREVEGSARLDVDDSVGVVFVDLWHDEGRNES